MNKETLMKRGKMCMAIGGVLFFVFLAGTIAFILIDGGSTENNRLLIICLAMTTMCCVITFFGGRSWYKHPEKYCLPEPDPNQKIYDSLYRNRGETYVASQLNYCKQTQKRQRDLTKDDELIIWDYSFDDFTYLLAWIITNNHFTYLADIYGEEDRESFMSMVGDIKERKESPVMFLLTSDGYFYKDEVDDKARGFVVEYFPGQFAAEIVEFAKSDLNSSINNFAFKWEDYDLFKRRIDDAFRSFNEEKK